MTVLQLQLQFKLLCDYAISCQCTLCSVYVHLLTYF